MQQLDLVADLLRSPAGVLLLELQISSRSERVADWRAGMAGGCDRLILRSPRAYTDEDLVAGLAGDIELPA